MQSGREQLRDWIDRRGWNQHETAVFLGITDVYVSQLLSGIRRPALANAFKIERLTGIPAVSWLRSKVTKRLDKRAGIDPQEPDFAKR